MRSFVASLAVGAVLLMIAGPSRSDPMPVQSGEHATFSRLVVQRAGTNWTTRQEGREVILQYEGFDQGFDTTEVFDFIPRDRIAAVISTADTLTLTLACDCVVSTFLERDAYVVIDVAASADGLENAPLAALPPDKPAAPQTPLIQLEQQAASLLPPAAPLAPATALRLPIQPDLAAKAQLSPAEQQVLADVQARLGSELSTATSRGVLDATSGLAPPTPTRPQIDTGVFYDTPEAAVVEAKSPLPGNNLRITTSRDLPETFRDLTEIVSNNGITCPPDTAVTIADWGTSDSFAVQMAKARQGLYGEFDRADPDVAMRLARTYLFFGFGAEAREILRLAPKPVKDQNLLTMMSHVLDGEAAPDPSTIPDLKGCDGEAALWAILTLPMPPQGSLPEADPALRSLNALPVHLRSNLAPKVSQILRAYGDPDGAATALRSLKRLPTALPPEAKMAQAALSLDEGDITAGTAQLAEVVTTNAQQSPQALIALVEAKAKANTPIAPETTGLIEAYARELKDTKLGPDLRRAQIIALANTGAFDRAFDLYERHLQTRPEGSTDWLDAHLLERLSLNADDITFLDHGFVQTQEHLRAQPPDVVIAFASRMFSLGFVPQAERVLSTVPDRPLQEDRQLLAARISLAVDKPFKAIAELSDVEGPQADALRADAKRLAGAHDEAHQLYAEAGRPEDAAEAAWLSENWRGLTPQESPVFGPVARLDPAPAPPVPTADGMLAHSASVLEGSAEARAALQSLLQAEDLQLGATKN